MKITCIGGGTGTTSVLKGLKQYPDLELSVIVTMMDDGGSNAVVRDEFGLLPLSDLRKSILALSNSNRNERLRELFEYRFSKGDGISGHTLGNLIMIALSDLTGSEKEAVRVSSEIFSVQGNIIPVTNEKVKLVAQYSDGTSAIGEHNIDEITDDKRIVKLSLNKVADADSDAIKAILNSEFIVIGPGDVYTSIIPNFLVKGISEALHKTKAKLIYISNLMTKKGETRGLSHLDIVKIIEEYAGRKMDYVLINKTKLPKNLLNKYAQDGEYPILDDISNIKSKRKIVKASLISNKPIKRQKGDTLKRSYIRHDSDKLGKELYYIFRRGFFDVISKLVTDN